MGIFGWLKGKAAKQSLFNVEITTRTLIVVANKAHEAIAVSLSSNPADASRVASAQKAVLSDVALAIDNGASVEDVLARIEMAKSKEKMTSGAEMAVAHMISYVKPQA
ncbi:MULTISPECIES: hypothetical protein [unclassified Mesorhizobium]|uniref:hypothetical protein n=1 Tax=unclassified Mesorhizobium TaxID=325217 RepID=UPI000F7534C1|nr:MULTISPECIES: hypothetical protein [unclassified Mesorhizobium]AZO68941.1 hypothetical protein EJ075_31200 [Mesorhizobium sp. M6A.T.Cr.TU.016.01.1.1]RWP45416.1 MAG: hypothetical protein EOR06_31315 [Mesorhizobium sp.]RWQ69291.1 MAG: hypothetical protein EOS85_29580 [Mesorhizobium sp.]